MTIKEICKSNLFPLNKGDQPKWDEFLNSLNDNILWFPEAQGRFEFYNYFAFARIAPDDKPSVFIHTDHLPDPTICRLIDEKIIELEVSKVKLENIIPLQFDWDYHFDYNNVHPNHRSVMAKFRPRNITIIFISNRKIRF